MSALAVLIGLLALGMVAHALRSCFLMLYAWARPERLQATAGPSRFIEPGLRFTALLPARDEPAVIGETIKRVWGASYPSGLLELIVICQADDTSTIEAALYALSTLDSPRARLALYEDEPFNKPHALNVGLARSFHEVVTIFDAEDDVHPDIFNVINTMMREDGVGVVQGGVQLVNFRDRWFSIFNCLEYYFHYKSRLHCYADAGVIPLGGNTVFFRRDLLASVGGWDVRCLTEDADIGMRLSALGHPIAAVYDSRWVTREETPSTVASFVRQRTRWHQGFLQILSRGDWRRLPGWRRRSLAFFTFAQPILDAALLVVGILTPLALLYLKLPVVVALLSCAPLYAIGLQMLTNVAGAVVFTRDHEMALPWWLLPRMALTYPAYQWLIAFAAVRASIRHVQGKGQWEKTEHRGAHRVPSPSAPSPGIGPSWPRPASGEAQEAATAQEVVA